MSEATALTNVSGTIPEGRVAGGRERGLEGSRMWVQIMLFVTF